MLDDNLEHLTIADDIKSCNNLVCKQHDGYIIQKLEDAIDIFKFCANSTIPSKIHTNRKKGIHGWNDFVKPYKEKSIFWNNIWKDAGSPHQGELANVRRFARYKYHWAIKTVNKQNNNRILEKNS